MTRWTCKFCGQSWSNAIGLCNCKEGLEQEGRLEIIDNKIVLKRKFRNEE